MGVRGRPLRCRPQLEEDLDRLREAVSARCSLPPLTGATIPAGVTMEGRWAPGVQSPQAAHQCRGVIFSGHGTCGVLGQNCSEPFVNREGQTSSVRTHSGGHSRRLDPGEHHLWGQTRPITEAPGPWLADLSELKVTFQVGAVLPPITRSLGPEGTSDVP